jgi:hydrogenase expression/formation protein HypC
MCVAIPGRVIDRRNDELIADCQGNRVRVVGQLTPSVRVGDWVLIHAGFSIATLDEKDALETWSYLNEMRRDDSCSDGGTGFQPVLPQGYEI